MKFTSLTELNNFVNKSESNIESIDVKNFTASTSSNKRTLNVMREEVKHPCYIIFNDKESYLEQKETLTITTDDYSVMMNTTCLLSSSILNVTNIYKNSSLNSRYQCVTKE